VGLWVTSCSFTTMCLKIHARNLTIGQTTSLDHQQHYFTQPGKYEAPSGNSAPACVSCARVRRHILVDDLHT